MLPLLSFSLGGAACGFDSLQKTFKLTLSFEVDEEKGEFSSQQDYKPDDNKDIKDNRELLEEAIINVRSVEVKFTQVPDQDARFAWGKVYAYPKGTTLSVNVAEDLQKPCKESEATACFESIALVSTAGTAGLSLDISPDQKVKIVDLVFNHPELTVEVVGWTDQKDKPVTFNANVIFSIDVKASFL